MDEFDNSAFMHTWQLKNMDCDEKCSVDKKVKAIRFSISQLDYLQVKERDFHGNALNPKICELLKEYGKLVDSPDKGINNYAEPIISLSKNCKNESKSWKSSMKVNDVITSYITPHNSRTTHRPQEEIHKFCRLIATEQPRNGNILFNQILDLNSKNEDKTSDYSENKESTECHFSNVFESRNINMLDSSSRSYNATNGIEQTGRQDRSDNLRDIHNANVSNIYREDQSQIQPHSLQSSKSFNDNLHSTGQRIYHSDSKMQLNSMPSYTRGRNGRYPWNVNQRPQVKDEPKSPWNVNQRPQVKDEPKSLNESNKFNENSSGFKTASHQLALEEFKKYGSRGSTKIDYGRRSNVGNEIYSNYGGDNGGRDDGIQDGPSSNNYGNSKRSLGIRRSVNSKFIPPIRRDDEQLGSGDYNGGTTAGANGGNDGETPYAHLLTDERLKNIDAKMVELIMNEILDCGSSVTWDDIAGLDLAKTTIQEVVVWPMLRPDIFTGLRGPPKGILLFGPPGTGKTMIGRCIASQSKSTFFSISASCLTSKWIGEGEKMVRALFAVARCHQPSVIFIDEIDSLLTQRSETEHESSRRIKTEFLVQLDGATCVNDDRLLVVGATNRPQELDEAARRRLVKRLYIPLPGAKAREQIIHNLMYTQSHNLTEAEVIELGILTDGYSGADMANLCREAALGPIRSIKFVDIQNICIDEVRAISADDMKTALGSIRASVSDQDLSMYQEWNKKYGISGR